MGKGGISAAGFLVLGALLAATAAAQTEAIEPAARKDIDAGNQAWVTGMKDGRAALIVATYAEHALDCAATGECVKGRAAIEEYMRARIAKLGRAKFAAATSLIKLRAARRAAQADVRASQADLRKAENEVALQVRQVYIGILIGRLEMQAMAFQVSASEQSLKEGTEGTNQNSEIQAARVGAEKAREGVRIGKAAYVPDVGAFAQYTYQNGVPFLVHNNGSVGLRMSWSVFDWGKRSAAIGEGETRLTQAEENVERLTRRVTLQVEKSYRNLELAKEMATTARAALEQARETRRLDRDRYIAGVSLASEDWRAKAGEAAAQASLLRADLNYLLAKGELDVTTGVAPK